MEEKRGAAMEELSRLITKTEAGCIGGPFDLKVYNSWSTVLKCVCNLQRLMAADDKDYAIEAKRTQEHLESVCHELGMDAPSWLTCEDRNKRAAFLSLYTRLCLPKQVVFKSNGVPTVREVVDTVMSYYQLKNLVSEDGNGQLEMCLHCALPSCLCA